MDFFEVVRRRRSIRRFTSDTVKEEDLKAILEAARLAPSPKNEQPWHFIVIRNPEFKKQLQEMVNAMMDTRIQLETDEVRRRRIEEMRFYANYFGQAPVVIAVLTQPWPVGRPELQGLQAFDSGLQGVSMAVAYILLAATALGYGSAWATAPVDFAGPELEAMLGVEKPWMLLGLASLGVAAHQPRPLPRKDLDEISTFVD
ncbi:MAG: nitroreductase family protein [Chloroflexi bacterium]|nr:nitroreductase family protein [Chloroflexota bacterium]